jgi:SAM-dependent methyltransferase
VNQAEWALRIFRRSVLKQEKYRQIVSMLGDVRGKTCLDIGADNGVISLLLRQRGGTWHSADLDEVTVDSIRRLVRDNVHRIDGRSTPFPDDAFDVVVIVDFLEHVHTDREFARELARILRPGGTLIVNVPRLNPRSLLNRFRNAIGLTDEKHGHVRPGYDIAGLCRVIGPDFTVERVQTYSRWFSEAVDTVLNGLYLLRSRQNGAGPSRKGPVMTEAEAGRLRKELRLLSMIYPALWLTTRADRLLFLQAGYKLIVRATLRKAERGQP